ncbi:hypothetical protein GOODEAATRI_000144 [Goodea atripinnis]|uniref:Metallothionein n=1 Tax=Goodea atripinnis TaxID=208336 RepID=A0ABV0NQP2_9TELE
MTVVRVSSNTVTLLSAVQIRAVWNCKGLRCICACGDLCVCVRNWGCALGAKGKHCRASFCSTCCTVAAQAKETDREEDVLYCGQADMRAAVLRSICSCCWRILLTKPSL